jgi:hypothetical protein
MLYFTVNGSPFITFQFSVFDRHVVFIEKAKIRDAIVDKFIKVEMVGS